MLNGSARIKFSLEATAAGYMFSLNLAACAQSLLHGMLPLQASLRDKTKQLKAMASELNMYQAQVAEYKYEIERLTRDLAGLKKKYFETKKREQLEKEVQRGTAAAAAGMLGSGKGAAAVAAAGQQQRFTGGGFSLSTVVG